MSRQLKKQYSNGNNRVEKTKQRKYFISNLLTEGIYVINAIETKQLFDKKVQKTG